MQQSFIFQFADELAGLGTAAAFALGFQPVLHDDLTKDLEFHKVLCKYTVMNYSDKQWQWLARVAYWARRLVITVRVGVDGKGEAMTLLGTHVRPDGSRVKLYLTAQIEPTTDPYSGGHHGHAPGRAANDG